MSGDRALVGFAAIGAATSWNSGNLGPVAFEIETDLDVGLGALGVLGGTMFFAGLVIAKLGAARLTARVGARAALRLTIGIAVLGNLAIAITPSIAGVGVGRLATGVSLGLALVLGPVLARALGGVRWVGIFGAAITIGLAAAIGVGSLLRQAGVEWRVDFAIAAAIAAAALFVLPPVAARQPDTGSVLTVARRSARSVPAWRLELLFTTSLGVPYVLGVWLVPYLTGESGLSSALAGVFGVTLYALSAVVRPEGARLEAGAAHLRLLGGIAPLIAAAGIAIVAIAEVAPLAAVGIVLAGVGFALPYGAMYDEAARLYPEAKVAAVGLFSVGGNALPLVVVPVIGAAIGAGHGEAAFVLLAAIALLAGLANLTPAIRPARS